ncbi:MAG: polymer-forming cytoskeletal protein, partial [Rhodoferax sp.]|nr:polymer-forming cytoskeletal protein [Rhodoferax sp.]
MALQSPFFGKRDTETTGLRRPTTMAQPNVHHGVQPSSAAPGASTSSSSPAPAAVAAVPAAAGDATPETTPSGGSRLTVGPNIKLKGVEITD